MPLTSPVSFVRTTPKMSANTLIPSSKFDIAAVSALEEAGYPAVASIIDDLLDWTADGNWPVAKPIADFLVTVGEPIAPSLKRVLGGKDAVHKYFCLELIVARLPQDVVRLLTPDLHRLADNPTADEVLEDVSAKASELLAILDS